MTAAEIARLGALLEKADSYATAACDPGCHGRCRVCPYAELQKLLNALPELLKAARDGERRSIQLWKLLDDIDALDDAAKGYDSEFRKRCYAIQRKRFEIMSGEQFDAAMKEASRG